MLGAVSDGIHCGKGKVNNEHNYFLMRGGNVNILNVSGDGIDSDDFGTVNIEGGTKGASGIDALASAKAFEVINGMKAK